MERSLHANLKTALLNNDEFTYAHLVKFERPTLVLNPTTGKASSDGKYYTYLTDSSVNLTFNDGSYKDDGTTANGDKIYRAEKVLKVGSYSETIQAKATSMALTLDSASLGATLTSTTISITSNSISMTATPELNFYEEGFREGDKITISGAAQSANNTSVNITGFSNASRTISVENIDGTIETESASNSITIAIDSPEIKGPLFNRPADATKPTYLNRSVYVYKVFLDPATGGIVGDGLLVFKGFIKGTSLKENPDQSSSVVWNLTSHWGDFNAVSGRITSDAFHRGLGANNRPDEDALIKPQYAYDLGFLHSEVALNALATYMTTETKIRQVTKKKGIFGLRKSISFHEEQVPVEREIELSINIQAKALPIIYGVQFVDGFPIFADITIVNDKTNIYVLQALSEGEIGGIFDVMVEGNPLICTDLIDYDVRKSPGGSGGTGTDVTCYGRADRGDVLSGNAYSAVTNVTNVPDNADNSYDSYGDVEGTGPASQWNFDPPRGHVDQTSYTYNNLNTVTGDNAGKGVRDLQQIRVTKPNTMTITAHLGSPAQTADSEIAGIANDSTSTNRFKRQQDYWTSAGSLFWGPNHRLLDTAYTTVKCTINADSTTIPELQYVVKGKYVECYNYDGSYKHITSTVSEPENPGSYPDINGSYHENFELGDLVTLQTKPDGGSWVNTSYTNVVIIDKWFFWDKDGFKQWRYRWGIRPGTSNAGAPVIPALGSNTWIRMKKDGANTYWTMQTYDYTLARNLTLTSNENLHVNPTAVSSASGAVTYTVLTSAITDANSNVWLTTGTEIVLANKTGGNTTFDNEPWFLVNTSVSGSNTIVELRGTVYNAFTATEAHGTALPTIKAARLIRLTTGQSTSAGFYADKKVILKKTDSSTGSIVTQERIIKSYIGGTNRLCEISVPWDVGGVPATDDKVTIIEPIGDPRVSINPSMQLLDYLTGVYGKNLELDDDINLDSFLLAGRTCDTRSDITISVSETTTAPENGVYHYTSDGTTFWQGTIKTNASASTSVTFTNCIGQLARRWNDWRVYVLGEIIHYKGKFYKVATAGTIAKASVTHTTTNHSIAEYITSFTVAIATGSVSGDSTITVNAKGVPIRYQLYDASEMKYYRYMGWEHQDQREVTRHQTNMVVQTSASVFNNVNSMLSNFNGILSFANGKYTLSVETETDAIASSISNGYEQNARYITDEDLIGNINIKDVGSRKSYNSVAGSIPDPQNRWEDRSVSFFNSTYLKADRGVNKSGRINIGSISNYFNARIAIENFLIKSRFGLTVSFDIGPKGLILLAGDTIKITYDRFGWTDKVFRITNLNYKENCTASITAAEYDASMYTITGPTADEIAQITSRPAESQVVPSPTSLTTSSLKLGIRATWVRNTNLPTSGVTELWAADSNDRAHGTFALIGEGSDGNTFYDDKVEAANTRYYWVRHRIEVSSSANLQNQASTRYSSYYPTSATGGVSGAGALLAAAQLAANSVGTDQVADNTIGADQVIDNSDLPVNVTGNAATATTATTAGSVTGGAGNLATPRNFSIAGQVTAPAIAFDGQANVALQSTLADNLTYGSNLTVTGNLTVNGTTTTINSTTLSVDDKNIELGSVGSPTDLTADGGGITLKGGTDKTILWENDTNTWDFNQAVRATGYAITNGSTYLTTGNDVYDWVAAQNFGSGSGDITAVDITAGTGLTGTVETLVGAHNQTLALSHLGLEALADPDADRIFFWDDSASAAKFLTIGTNLVISGTTLNASNTTYTNSSWDHDQLTNFAANEHINWTADQGSTNIHTGNYTNTTYVDSDWDHDSLTNFLANEHIDWTADQGSTNIHTGNYTDTTYSEATGSAAGLMSIAHHDKLDGIATSANNYSHPTSAGNKHIPTSGASGNFLKYDSSGTAVWATPSYTTNTDRYVNSAAFNTSNGVLTLTRAGSDSSTVTVDLDGKYAESSHSHSYDNYSSWTIQDGDSTTYTVTSGDTLQIAEGTYIDSNFTADDVLTISHTDTSSVSNVDNSGNTFIQDMTFDGAGHVTGITSTAWTDPGDDDTTYSIKAETVLGGADLDLDAGGTGSGTDTVKFASAGATTVSRTDASTIQISSVNTTYTAGGGIALSGTQFSVAGGTALTQDASGLSITAGAVTATQLALSNGNGSTSQWLRSDGDGTFTWDAPPNTTYTAGNGLTLSTTEFLVDTHNPSSTNITLTATGDGLYGDVKDGGIDNVHLGVSAISLDKMVIEQFPTVVWKTTWTDSPDDSPDAGGEIFVAENTGTNRIDNNANMNVIASLRIFETDLGGLNIAALLTELTAASYIRISQGGGSRYATVKLDGSASVTGSDPNRYYTVNVASVLDWNGDFDLGTATVIEFQVKTDAVVDGNLVVSGTITADAIAANTISADEIVGGTGRFTELVADIGTFTTLDTDTLDANSVIARTIQVGTAGSLPTISGTTLGGKGIMLKNDGDFYAGNSAGGHLFWDQSTEILTVTGAITATSGTFTGAVNASSGAFTGYVTGGTARFGANVQSTNDGIWLNANNYWYDSGVIKAVTGTIGGWTLAAAALYNGRSALTTGTGIYIGTDGIAIGNNAGTPQFKILASGALTATSATISGDITATSGSFTGAIAANSGSIGGWSIGSTLTAGSSGSYIELAPATPKIRIGAKASLTDGNTGVHIGSDGIALGASSVFKVTNAGVLTATSATITGAINATSGSFTGAVTANSGSIGGWAIGSTLTAGSSASYIELAPATPKIRIGAKASLTDGNTGVHIGSDGIALGASSVFKVTNAGVLTATSATITGTITANDGALGGWNIDSDAIYSGTKDVSGFTSTAGHLTIAAAGSIHSRTFYIDTAGDAFFAGSITTNATIAGEPADEVADQSVAIRGDIVTTLLADTPVATWLSDDRLNYTPSAGAGGTFPNGSTGNIDITLRAINDGVESTATWRWTLENYTSGFIPDDITGAWEGSHSGWTNATVGGSAQNRTVVITYDSKTLTLRAMAINITISGGGK